MTEFAQHHRARSPLVIVGALFCAVVGLLGLVAGQGLAKLIGAIFAGIAGLMAVSAGRKEEWRLQIASGLLTWSYPKSWAPASGRIVLAEVVRADINDDLPIPALTLVSKSGDTQKVLLAGYGHALYQHLSVRYPEIKISYVPPTSTG